MFKLVPSPTFPADVALTVPGQDATGSVRFVFKHLGRAALAAWHAQAAGQNEVTDADWLASVVVTWEGPVDEAGAAVPYSRDALAALLDAYPAAGRELYAAYLAAQTESRAKN